MSENEFEAMFPVAEMSGGAEEKNPFKDLTTVGFSRPQRRKVYGLKTCEDPAMEKFCLEEAYRLFVGTTADLSLHLGVKLQEQGFFGRYLVKNHNTKFIDGGKSRKLGTHVLCRCKELLRKAKIGMSRECCYKLRLMMEHPKTSRKRAKTGDGKASEVRKVLHDRVVVHPYLEQSGKHCVIPLVRQGYRAEREVTLPGVDVLCADSLSDDDDDDDDSFFGVLTTTSMRTPPAARRFVASFAAVPREALATLALWDAMSRSCSFSLAQRRTSANSSASSSEKSIDPVTRAVAALMENSAPANSAEYMSFGGWALSKNSSNVRLFFSSS